MTVFPSVASVGWNQPEELHAQLNESVKNTIIYMGYNNILKYRNLGINSKIKPHQGKTRRRINDRNSTAASAWKQTYKSRKGAAQFLHVDCIHAPNATLLGNTVVVDVLIRRAPSISEFVVVPDCLDVIPCTAKSSTLDSRSNFTSRLFSKQPVDPSSQPLGPTSPLEDWGVRYLKFE